MKLPAELLPAYNRVLFDEDSQQELVEAIVRDCAEEAHYEAGPGLGPIVERHLLVRYGLEPK